MDSVVSVGQFNISLCNTVPCVGGEGESKSLSDIKGRFVIVF